MSTKKQTSTNKNKTLTHKVKNYIHLTEYFKKTKKKTRQKQTNTKTGTQTMLLPSTLRHCA